tara:strand:- start:202 stop:417 length:216 start_codon:yes stop_codon:yes gene_type:complete
MGDNSLLMIVLAFVLGCMCSQMMKQMCGGRLVEGSLFDFIADSGKEKGDTCKTDYDCRTGLRCNEITKKCF